MSELSRHNYLIRSVQLLEPEKRHNLEAELRFKCRKHYATFRIEGEVVFALLDVTEHTLGRLVEHYGITYTEGE